MDEFNPYQPPRCPARVSDVELLRRFRGGQDESAFAELVARHGPMVFGVCRRVLQHAQDAEDAFQATFLVLVRRARFIRSDGSLVSWLYGVALRTALKALAMRKRNRSHCNEQLATLAERRTTADALMEVLDLELARLPARQRAVLVLCDLEGKTYREAADELRLALGSVSGLLVRARQRLRERLSRRGIAFSALGGAATLMGVGTPVPPELAASTAKLASSFAAGGAVNASAQVAALVKCVSLSLALTKTKALAGVLISAVGLWLGTARDDVAPVVAGVRPRAHVTLVPTMGPKVENQPQAKKSTRRGRGPSLEFSASSGPIISGEKRPSEPRSRLTKGS